MREISFEEVKELWDRCTTPVMVYIHSPFCEQRCSYCVYRGMPGVPKDIEERYFSEYLPHQIEKYYPVLDTLSIRSFYFGGGTPNHRGDIEHLRPVVEALRPYTEDIEEMAIELHMGYEVTYEQLKTLKDWGFTTIILCAQTFNTEVLKTKNRLCQFEGDSYWQHIDKVSGWCKELGIQTGMDLMYFPKDPSGLETLKSDLKIITEKFSNPPDEVTVAPFYEDRNEDNFAQIYAESVEGLAPLYSPHLNMEKNKSCKVIRFFQGEKYRFMYSFIPFLEDGTSISWGVSTLGIGSYNNLDKWTFSNINQTYTLVEECTSIEEEPKYVLTKEISFWDKCRNIIDFMEEACCHNDPPSEFCLHIKNNPETDLYKIQEDNSVYFGFSNNQNQVLGNILVRTISSLGEEGVREIELRKRDRLYSKCPCYDHKGLSN